MERIYEFCSSVSAGWTAKVDAGFKSVLTPKSFWQKANRFWHLLLQSQLFEATSVAFRSLECLKRWCQLACSPLHSLTPGFHPSPRHAVLWGTILVGKTAFAPLGRYACSCVSLYRGRYQVVTACWGRTRLGSRTALTSPHSARSAALPALLCEITHLRMLRCAGCLHF